MLTEAFNHLTAIPAYIWNRSEENAEAAKAALDKFSGLASTVQYISKYPAIIGGLVAGGIYGITAAAESDSITFVKKETFGENQETLNKVRDVAAVITALSVTAWFASYATRNWAAPFVSSLIK